MSRVVAIFDWQAAALLKQNIRFLERRGVAGAVQPRDWRAGAARYRSLTIYEDGNCLLQRPSAAVVARRLGGVKRTRITKKRGTRA